MTRALVLFYVLSGSALAHTPSESFSSWEWSDGVLTMRFTTSMREVARARLTGVDELHSELAAHIASTSGPVEPSCSILPSSHRLPAQPGWMRFEFRWRCAREPTQITVAAFADLVPEHSHYVSYSARGRTLQSVLGNATTRWDLAGESVSVTRAPFYAFVTSGFRHVLGGLDHLAFLLALLLVVRRTRDIVAAITGFTVGHMVALAAVGQGVLVLDQSAVESLIGFTVMLVCIEWIRLSGRDTRFGYGLLLTVLCVFAAFKVFLPAVLGWLALLGVCAAALCYLELSGTTKNSWPLRGLLAAAFGLVHGAGFAAGFVASEIEGTALLTALLGFNLGVEFGQLLFVAIVLLLVRQLGFWRQSFPAYAAAGALLGVGVYWFLGRGFVV